MIFLSHISQLLTLRGDHTGPRRGAQMRELGIIEDGALLIDDGKIGAVGKTAEVERHPLAKKAERTMCTGNVVMPGFVDSHTHPIFTAPRLIDFEKRIAGAGYEEIAAAGGGIQASLRGVRETPATTLISVAHSAFERMALGGTTTIEAKSGYGLTREAELKSLEAIGQAARQFAGTVVPTLLGAHVVPPEYRNDPDEYVRIVCEEMIPAAAGGLKPGKQLRSELNGAPKGAPLRDGKRDQQPSRLAQFVDVFCERGAFTMEQSRRILRAAVAHGLGVRAHVCQLTPAKLESLMEFHPASLDHMDFVNDDDIAMLAKADTVATLLPAANYFLGLQTFPPARKLIDSGVAVALATDYNPGTAPTPSMQFVLSAACTHMKMSPAEAIAATTYNGACALRLQERKGSLEVGKDADVAIFSVRDYRELAYWFGENYCRETIRNGIRWPPHAPATNSQ